MFNVVDFLESRFKDVATTLVEVAKNYPVAAIIATLVFLFLCRFFLSKKV